MLQSPQSSRSGQEGRPLLSVGQRTIRTLFTEIAGAFFHQDEEKVRIIKEEPSRAAQRTNFSPHRRSFRQGSRGGGAERVYSPSKGSFLPSTLGRGSKKIVKV